jgi:hypothetical protein
MRVGVMLLENTHMRGTGSMANPQSYLGEVLFETLPGVMGRVLVDRPEQVRDAVVATARRLCSRGADILTMNCGFGVLFQQDLVKASQVTIASSSLLLLPTLAMVHGGKVGVITFDKAALSGAHLAAAGWPPSAPLAVSDVQHSAEWRLLDEERPVELPLELMGRQLLATARSLVGNHSLSALALECSGMVPFAPMLRSELGCSVHTVLDLVNFAARGRKAA